MGDGILKWFGAGMVTAGLTAGMLASAGLAVATDGTTSESSDSSTSESSDSTDSTQDSTSGAVEDSSTPDDGAVASDVDEEDPAEEEPVEEEPVEEEPAEEEPAEEPAEEEPVEGEPAVKDDEDTTDRGTNHDSADDSIEADPQPATTPDDVTVEAQPQSKAVIKDDDEAVAAPSELPVAAARTVVLDTPVVEETPEVEAVAFASAPVAAAVDAAATGPQIPGIIRVIGTLVFNLYAIATRVFGGPPILPANSTVTVRSSSLRIDCGCEEGEGAEVPADWYIPAGAEENPPERLIYLQHGFLAAGPWYSHTAAALAEQTNSIVVAPSITSNFLAADACWLGAAPMHEAMANLFDEDNTALAESALAAGYDGPIPDRMVLMGHSLGGGAVSGMAGYMAAPENDSIDRLAGVVLLDGVGLDREGAMAESLGNVPDEIPIYQLAAPKYFWNQFGVGTDALAQARPDDFIGVTLVGGAHVDTMRGGNPIIQFAQQLVSGFSKRENVAAARMLMVGWVNDMFAGNQQTGIYLDPGEEFTLDTPSGEAALVALPNELTMWFPLNFLQPFVRLANGIFTFEPTCVAESIAAADSCTPSKAA